MAESGIYEIVNLVNGKRYVGSTSGLKRRWQDHRSYLKRGRHHCHILQRAWLKYGEAAFEFRIIECCAPADLIVREQAAIEALKPEYNICPRAGSSRGVKHTSEARANMAAAQREHWSDPLARQALIARILSPEHRARSREANLGNKYSLGRVRAAAEREKISAALRGTKHHQTDWTVYTLRHSDGREVSGIQIDLRGATGVTGPELSRLLRHKGRTAKGWRNASP